jgi:hypothetical protein
MDIRNVFGSLWAKTTQKNEPVKRGIEMGSTTDRDADGRRSDQQQSSDLEDQTPMSDENFLKAIEHLKSLAVVKDQNLVVEKQMIDQRRFVVLRELSGKVIRRISERELKTLQVVTDKDKGQLLRKTA